MWLDIFGFGEYIDASKGRFSDDEAVFIGVTDDIVGGGYFWDFTEVDSIVPAVDFAHVCGGEFARFGGSGSNCMGGGIGGRVVIEHSL